MTQRWFEKPPEQCPPQDAKVCNGLFYRIANGNPATSADFFSQRKLSPDKTFKGKGIDECTTRAVSLFAELDDAKKRLKLHKFRNANIAAVTLRLKDGMMKKTLPTSTNFLKSACQLKTTS